MEYTREKETYFIPQKIELYLRGKRDFTDVEYMYMDIYAYKNQYLVASKYSLYLDIRKESK